MEGRTKSIINNSPSKAQYRFPKASRFVSPKQHTHAFGYEIKGYFSENKKQGQGSGFMSSESRFGYDEMRKKKRDAGVIQGPQDTSIDAVKNKTYSYRFGVSRECMKKIHVDEILKKKEENLPGPDRYEKKHLFGGTQGTNYSVRKKIMDFEQHLDKQKKLPGPGYYEQNNLVGGALGSSVMRSAQSNKFPQAQDRFRMPKMQSPPPTKYAVKDAINENFNSTRQYAGHTRIGKNTRSFMDDNWYLRKAKIEPGPGAYSTFSDFSGQI